LYVFGAIELSSITREVIMRYFYILTVVIFIFSGCGPVQYHTLYDGVKDPLFEFNNSKTIGLLTTYWTQNSKANEVDELTEKQILAYCKTELEKRGFKVIYIPQDNIREIGDNIQCYGLDEYPDLTLSVGYLQRSGTVNVPAESFGSLSFNNYGGYGMAGGRGSYNVNVWDLAIAIALWAEPPEYTRKVWRGSIVQGSPKPDLNKRASTLVRKLFNREFPKVNIQY